VEDDQNMNIAVWISSVIVGVPAIFLTLGGIGRGMSL